MNIFRAPLVATAAAGTVILFAGPAFAHVSVDPGEAGKGGYSTIAFKVPNERDDASTVRLEVALPADHPLASVMPQPVPGWEVKVTTAKLDKPLEQHGKKIDEAVTRVVWTASKNEGIRPGTFQQFPLSVGPLPEDGDQLVFKTLQTYDDHEIVRWIEEPKEGGAEPDHPAPVLKLTEAAEGESGHVHGSGSGVQSSDDTTDTAARVLGVVGIVIGAAGIAFGILAGRRRSA
jgi:uncharacterized protein YcnI